MPIARITSQGLLAIALVVSALWACILTEHSITRSAYLIEAQSLHDLQMLRSGIRKVNAPAHRLHRNQLESYLRWSTRPRA